MKSVLNEAARRVREARSAPPIISTAVMIVLLCGVAARSRAQTNWKMHVLIETTRHVRTANVGDLTSDGIPDIIASCDSKQVLFVGPDFKPHIIDDAPGHDYIHSVVTDVDGDGDLDFIGAKHRGPGRIYWYEQPENPTQGEWPAHQICERLSGIHSIALSDVDGDGKQDLLATSANKSAANTPTEFPESLVWYRFPDNPRDSGPWNPIAFADKDAPGMTHYLGVGDINLDGRLDAAVGAKVGDFPDGKYFAWWEAPEDPTTPWKKHLVPTEHDGATHIIPFDMDRDGQMDLVASRGHGLGVFWLKGPYWEEQPIHPEISCPHSLLLRDLDGDGDHDVATCAFGSQQAWWYENNGRGVFRKHLVATGQQGYDIHAHDVDLDGDFDLVIAGGDSCNAVWCENPSR